MDYSNAYHQVSSLCHSDHCNTLIPISKNLPIPSSALQPVDYSNAYRQDGSPNPAHELWCSALSLLGLLLAALPGGCGA